MLFSWHALSTVFCTMLTAHSALSASQNLMCADVKRAYKAEACCGSPQKTFDSSKLTKSCASGASMHCEVAVLGGGVGGLYSALRLAEAGRDVCLFEKEDFFGGRLKAVQFETDPEKRWVGVGGLRLDDLHHTEKHLAHELNISLQWRYYKKMTTNTRGIFASNSTGTRRGFPTLTTALDEGLMYEQFMGAVNYNTPRNMTLPDIRPYTTVEDYIRGTLGPEALMFLRNNFRFRADFTDNDIRSYLQFLHLDFAESSYPYLTGYPVGGMSAFARALASQATTAGANLSTGDAVLSLDGSKADGYCVVTEKSTVATKKVIVAIDPFYFKDVAGELARALQAERSFRDAKPIPVAIVMQRYASPWWLDAFHGQASGEVRRVQTTDNCLNYIEIPVHTHYEEANVVRTVFADGPCAEYWKSLHSADPSLALMNGEIRRSLGYLFHVTIPEALETHFQYWPNAWHFQQPSAQRDLFEVESWAKRPFPAEDVALVGEAWSPYRAWVKGAVLSAMLALNEQHGLQLEAKTQSPSGWPADPSDSYSVVASSRRLASQSARSGRS